MCKKSRVISSKPFLPFTPPTHISNWSNAMNFILVSRFKGYKRSLTHLANVSRNLLLLSGWFSCIIVNVFILRHASHILDCHRFQITRERWENWFYKNCMRNGKLWALSEEKKDDFTVVNLSIFHTTGKTRRKVFSAKTLSFYVYWGTQEFIIKSFIYQVLGDVFNIKLLSYLINYHMCDSYSNLLE